MASRASYLALVGLVLTLVTPSFLAPYVNAEGLQPWSGTTSYPVHVYLERCVSYSAHVYCIGGNNGTNDINSVYYAALGSSGVSSWIPTTSYPTTIDYAACVADSGYVYCVGGSNYSGAYFNEVYYAPISSGGALGPWQPTTSYPSFGYGQSCVPYSGYIYCVGGYDGGFTNAVYFAPMSSSGVGTWQPTTSYPFNISFQSCVVYSGDIYCVAGDDNGVTAVNATNYVYYAPVTLSGVGAWQRSTDYPMNITDEECVVNSGYVYCIGGYSGGTLDVGEHYNVYYATLSPTGIGTWQSSTSYPVAVVGHSCVSELEQVYCIAGSTNTLDDVVYYSKFLSSTATSVSCSESNVSYGAPVTCTAVVKGVNATGTVAWNANNTSSFNPAYCTLLSGNCSATYTASGSGVTMITAKYSGDSSNSPSSGTIILQVSGSSSSVISKETNNTTSSFSSSEHCSNCGSGPGPLTIYILIVAAVLVVTGSAVGILRGRRVFNKSLP